MAFAAMHTALLTLCLHPCRQKKPPNAFRQEGRRTAYHEEWLLAGSTPGGGLIILGLALLCHNLF